MRKISFFLAVFFLLCNFTISAQNTGMDHTQTPHVILNGVDLQWGDGPPSLPAGVKVAVLEGHPTKSGMLTLRATMPANYRIPPHWHPVVEHVTVLEGTLYMGTGEKLDEGKAMELKPGGFAVMPAKTAHYAFTKEGCTIQVHAMGPFEITYINPADDPRKK